MRKNCSVFTNPLCRALLAGFLVLPCVSGWGQFPNPLAIGGVSVRLLPSLTPDTPTFGSEVWTPLGLEVENLSDKTIEGRLVVTPYSEFEEDHEYRYEIPIRFAPSQKKLFRLTALIPDWTEDLVVYFEPHSRRTPVARVGVRRMDESERLVVAMGEGESSYGGFDLARTNGDQLIRSISVRSLYRSDLLPEQVQSYDGVSTLVWDGLRLDEPAPAQISALEDYVELGGTLVLALGDRGERLDVEGFRGFLDNVPRESVLIPLGEEVRGTPVDDFREPLTRSFRWTTQLAASGQAKEGLVASVGNFPGEPCVFLNDEPLLYRERKGAGWVFVSRISFADWLKLGERGKEFWQKAVEAAPLRAPNFAPHTGLFHRYLENSLLGELPSAWFIGGFLGLYTLLAIPGSYLLFRKRRRLELAWLPLPFYAVLFSFLAYHLGSLQQQGGVVQRQIDVAFLPPGSTKARVQASTAVYSPTRNVFELSTEGNVALPVPLAPDDNSFSFLDFDLSFGPSTEVAGETTPSVPNLTVPHWASQGAAIDTVADLGGPITVEATQTADGGFSVRLDNRLDYDIERTYIVRFTSWTRRGAVASGSTETISVGKDEGEPIPQQDPRYYAYQTFHNTEMSNFLQSFGEPVAAMFPNRITAGGARVLDRYTPPSTTRPGMYVLAVLNQNISPIDVGVELLADEAATLLLLPVGLNFESETRVLLPGDWGIESEEMTSGLRANQGSLQIGAGGASDQAINSDTVLTFYTYNQVELVTATFIYKPGWRLSDSEPISLEINLDKKNSNENVNQRWSRNWFVFEPGSKEWTPLDEDLNLEGESCRKLFDENDDSIRFRLVLKPKEGEEGRRNYNAQQYLPRVQYTYREEVSANTHIPSEASHGDR